MAPRGKSGKLTQTAVLKRMIKGCSSLGRRHIISKAIATMAIPPRPRPNFHWTSQRATSSSTSARTTAGTASPDGRGGVRLRPRHGSHAAMRGGRVPVPHFIDAPPMNSSARAAYCIPSPPLMSPP
ncbi:hypothetical protein SAY86_028925 [Trapa natans]|uniref:Uncharacterized protein n=1 Tax=Trapa natans TaxID=22666 RepID=A0AAN7M1F4_TRANT|nr:hypothetical protein SAY86_028925 [Trapa natans]